MDQRNFFFIPHVLSIDAGRGGRGRGVPLSRDAGREDGSPDERDSSLGHHRVRTFERTVSAIG
jgi:hypothetical protein